MGGLAIYVVVVYSTYNGRIMPPINTTLTSENSGSSIDQAHNLIGQAVDWYNRFYSLRAQINQLISDAGNVPSLSSELSEELFNQMRVALSNIESNLASVSSIYHSLDARGQIDFDLLMQQMPIIIGRFNQLTHMFF